MIGPDTWITRSASVPGVPLDRGVADVDGWPTASHRSPRAMGWQYEEWYEGNNGIE